jgi:hypothetical protein
MDELAEPLLSGAGEPLAPGVTLRLHSSLQNLGKQLGNGVGRR